MLKVCNMSIVPSTENLDLSNADIYDFFVGVSISKNLSKELEISQYDLLSQDQADVTVCNASHPSGMEVPG